MNTKFLMIASAIFLGMLGLALTFIPDDVFAYLNQSHNEIIGLILQLTGALYFGFALMNWMSKGVLIGGIYARPLCIGNVSHFLIGGLALVKFCMNGGSTSMLVYIFTFVYLTFALLFGYVMITSPTQK